MNEKLPISRGAWNDLVEANRQAVLAGWATEGVFATGVGPKYPRDGFGSLLYVGKSAGPLGHAVGSCNDQAASVAASTQWMVGRENTSAFWQLVDKVDQTRQSIAWTNVCKMDRIGGVRPPSEAKWRQVADACMAALEDEIAALSPRVIVFATSETYRSDISALLRRLEYRSIVLDFDDGYTICFKSPGGMFAIKTRHPQGWNRELCDRVVDLTMDLMSGQLR